MARLRDNVWPTTADVLPSFAYPYPRFNPDDEEEEMLKSILVLQVRLRPSLIASTSCNGFILIATGYTKYILHSRICKAKEGVGDARW